MRYLAAILGLCLGGFYNLSAQQSTLQPSLGQDYQRALELFEKEQYGNAQLVFDVIAAAELQQPRSTRALAAYQAARCAIYLYNGDIEERLAAFSKNFELNPLIDQLYLAYANNLFSLKRYRQAAEYYQKTNPQAVSQTLRDEYRFKLAYSLLDQEKNQAAQEIFFKLKDGESAYANSSKYYYAHLLYADSSYAQALQNFLPLQDDPSFGPLVPYYLAHIYYELKDYDKLVAVGEELVQKASPNRAPEIAKLVADAFYTQKDYKNALAYLDIYSNKGGRMRTADYFQKGYAHYQQSNYYAAIENFNKITGGPDDLRQNTYYHLGDCYLKTDQKRKARTAFKAAAEITSQPAIAEDAAYNYAKLAYELADPFQDAITTLNNYLNDYPQSPHYKKINGYLANLYITTKDYDRAIVAIERSGINSPEMRGAYQRICFYRATELFNSRRYQAAIDKYIEALKFKSSTRIAALSQYWLAESYYRMLEYDKAITTFKGFRESAGAANLNEFNFSYYTSGYAHYKKLDFQNAALNFRQFVGSEAVNTSAFADAYLRLGDSYLLTSGYLAAADFYKKALQNNTTEADYAYYQRAICLGLAGNGRQKVDELEKLLRNYPQSTFAEDAQLEIAQTYLQLDENEKALSALSQFENKFSQSEKMATVSLKRGLIYSNTDANAKALDTYKEVVQQYPGSQEAIEAIGLAEIVYKRQNNIEGYLDWVATLDFVDFEKSALDSTAFNAAYDLYAQSFWDKAYSSFTGYLKRFENGLFRLNAHYYAAQSAEQLNKPENSFENYLAIAKMPKNAYSEKALMDVASYYFTAENMAEAQRWYKKLAATTSNAERQLAAQKGLMETSMALGAYADAARLARQILNSNTKDDDLRKRAQMLEAQAFYKNEQYAEALLAYETSTTTTAGEDLAESYYYTALLMSKQGQLEKSNEVVNMLIENLPSFKEWKLKGLLLMAENFVTLEDIFQANYIIDFILETDFSPELNERANALREQIKAADAKALQEKKQLMQQQSQSINLDAESGLELIDLPEEEPVEPPVEIKDPKQQWEKHF